MRIAILSNDVIPGMGVPVAAPGIRAWGMALGLRELGHEVTVIVEQWLVNQVWQGTDVPPPTPEHATILPAKRVGEFVRTHRCAALVICNSNQIEKIGDLGDCKLVYDFFAPKVLEMSENLEREDLAEALQLLEKRKLLALSRSHAVISNGEKKLDYVREWMSRAGVGDLPVAVVNPGLPPITPRPRAEGPLELIVSGYLQPWSRPGAWLDAVVPLLDEGKARLNLLLGNHWARVPNPQVMPETLQSLADRPDVVNHGLLRLGDFRALLARCHASIDVFSRNPERELAMVTRSVVALSSGLPVMHVDFTEVSPWIASYDAGWLVPEDDPAAMNRALRAAADDPDLLARKRDGAARVAHEVLAPAVAATPLTEILRGL